MTTGGIKVPAAETIGMVGTFSAFYGKKRSIEFILPISLIAEFTDPVRFF